MLSGLRFAASPPHARLPSSTAAPQPMSRPRAVIQEFFLGREGWCRQASVDGPSIMDDRYEPPRAIADEHRTYWLPLLMNQFLAAMFDSIVSSGGLARGAGWGAPPSQQCMSISTRRPWSLGCASLVALALLGSAWNFSVGATDSERPSRLVSPTVVHDDVLAGRPLLFIDAAAASPPQSGPEVRRVYYTRSPSTRAATEAVRRDQNQGLPAQRLTGTPVDWAELGLALDLSILESGHSVITPRELAEALADEVDVQIVDLRGAADDVGTSSVSADALRLLPHEFESALPELSRRRWLVLVDDGHGVANAFADLAFARGYVLVAVLEGGYPAWIKTES